MIDRIIDTLNSFENEYDDLSIIAKYEDARQIIKELVQCGFDLKSIRIEDEECDGYDSEYIISISYSVDNYEIWCEPMLRDTGYLTCDSNATYIVDNCSSKVIPYCKGDTVYEVSIGEERKCNCVGDNNCLSDSEYTYISRGNDGIPTGFRKSWWSEEDGVTCFSSYSHYSNDIDVLRDIAKEFDVKL